MLLAYLRANASGILRRRSRAVHGDGKVRRLLGDRPRLLSYPEFMSHAFGFTVYEVFYLI